MMQDYPEDDLETIKHKAKLWDKHRKAIHAANTIIQAARPVLLNMMMLEEAEQEAQNEGSA